MPRRTRATPFLDALARQLALENAPPNPNPETAEIPGTISDARNERSAAPRANVRTLLYVVSLGVIATATVAVFFGIGFFLLAHPREEIIASFSANDRSVEGEPRRPDLFPLPDADAPPLQPATASAHPVAPTQALVSRGVLPPGNDDAARGSSPTSPAGNVAANATPGASSSRELSALRSTGAEATLVSPPGVTYTARAGGGRHRHKGTRKHWAVVSRPEAIGRAPPAVSGPERAWRWIARSVTSVLASLSPPPPRQPPGLKTR
jgi:hypothetical protein